MMRSNNGVSRASALYRCIKDAGDKSRGMCQTLLLRAASEVPDPYAEQLINLFGQRLSQ